MTLYILQNKIHQLCKLMFKVGLIKYFFLSVKIHVFRITSFDLLKNEILKKQTKNRKFLCVKK